MVEGKLGAALACPLDKVPVQVALTELAEGDAVVIAHEKKAIARGLVRYSAEQMKLILGKSSNAIPAILGFSLGPEVVHRDDLVLLDGA